MTHSSARHSAVKSESAGAGPFVTFRRYSHLGRIIEWRARHHRKGLYRAARAIEDVKPPFWHTPTYNWWIGFLFAIGALLFVVGSALTLSPYAVKTLTLLVVNSVFFAGSIPFTLAAYLQHFQAANADQPEKISLIGWKPDSPGWLSTICQFVGTVFFNFNTFDAIHSPSGVVMQNIAIWLPGMVGSVLFLASAYLAFIETAHAFWVWRKRDLAWQIVFINLIGCVFFLAASTLFWAPSGAEPSWIPVAANTWLGLGALCFLIGAGLLMREANTGA